MARSSGREAVFAAECGRDAGDETPSLLRVVVELGITAIALMEELHCLCLIGEGSTLWRHVTARSK
jgi:hypothetical protein